MIGSDIVFFFSLSCMHFVNIHANVGATITKITSYTAR